MPNEDKNAELADHKKSAEFTVDSNPRDESQASEDVLYQDLLTDHGIGNIMPPMFKAIDKQILSDAKITPNPNHTDFSNTIRNVSVPNGMPLPLFTPDIQDIELEGDDTVKIMNRRLNELIEEDDQIIAAHQSYQEKEDIPCADDMDEEEIQDPYGLATEVLQMVTEMIDETMNSTVIEDVHKVYVLATVNQICQNYMRNLLN